MVLSATILATIDLFTEEALLDGGVFVLGFLVFAWFAMVAKHNRCTDKRKLFADLAFKEAFI